MGERKLPTVTINATPEQVEKLKEIFTKAVYESYMGAVKEGKVKPPY